MALTIQQQYDEAQTAYHKLMTGTAARVVVDTDGSRVEFTVANASKLYAYIQTLAAQLPATTTSCVPNNAPLQFLF
jgi:gpW